MANRSVAVLLVVLGIAVAFVPANVPGLTLPDSPAAARAMESMDMHNSSSGGGSINDQTVPSIGGMSGTKTGTPAP